MEFLVLIIVSILVLLLIMRYALRSRSNNPLKSTANISTLSLLTVICMIFGKYGANTGLPCWIYYTTPMLLTVFFPLIYFRMNKSESIKYLLLTFISAPLIHIIFSFFFGWKNYMPFISIPSIWEILKWRISN